MIKEKFSFFSKVLCLGLLLYALGLSGAYTTSSPDPLEEISESSAKNTVQLLRDLPHEIYSLILKELHNKERLDLSLVNKACSKIVSQHTYRLFILSSRCDTPLTDAILKPIVSRFYNLKTLNFQWNDSIPYEDMGWRFDSEDFCLQLNFIIKPHIKSQWLSAGPSFKFNAITNQGIEDLTGLTGLCLGSNNTIDDGGLRLLTNLRTLSIGSNVNITNEGIEGLTGLTGLCLGSNNTIDDKGLRLLTNLRTLSIGSNLNITHEGIKDLTALTGLSLDANNTIDDGKLRLLTNLSTLSMGSNVNITHEGIEGLTGLTGLSLGANNTIDDKGLRPLKVLRSLCLGTNHKITMNALVLLENLTYLDFYCSNIKIDAALLLNMVSYKKLKQIIFSSDASLNTTRIIALSTHLENKNRQDLIKRMSVLDHRIVCFD